ncbi:large conductance mechanosensitive channel protein MscL [Actinomyces weissii]|uniref:Large-conductance mechanosensitive channel n=1 Tax=Actinomyces weissii TaxID=675090 RepID=A0A7T7MA58_9ACTO|nr:large conductance mechanosensitive channel protein MscL [Actinomyces weissii]QQM67157.1 large conductance mechanosensitive channel protein MscL [Actinomyces weissii]
MLQGFKDFISRGNAIDLAVGVIIGAAFKSIVDALVEKVLNPLIGGIFGQPNFDSLGKFTVGSAEVLPGAIITALVNFLLIAFALYFFLVVPMNKINEKKKAGEADAPAEPTDVELLTEIRDLLSKR